MDTYTGHCGMVAAHTTGWIHTRVTGGMVAAHTTGWIHTRVTGGMVVVEHIEHMVVVM